MDGCFNNLTCVCLFRLAPPVVVAGSATDSTKTALHNLLNARQKASNTQASPLLQLQQLSRQQPARAQQQQQQQRDLFGQQRSFNQQEVPPNVRPCSK